MILNARQRANAGRAGKGGQRPGQNARQWGSGRLVCGPCADTRFMDMWHSAETCRFRGPWSLIG